MFQAGKLDPELQEKETFSARGFRKRRQKDEDTCESNRRRETKGQTDESDAEWHSKTDEGSPGGRPVHC